MSIYLLNVRVLGIMLCFLSEVGINVNYSQCALASMSYSDMTVLLTAIVNNGSSVEAEKLPSPQIIPETKLKKVLAVILTGAQINSSLRTDTALEWYINTFCESSLSNNLSKDVRQVSIAGKFLACIVCKINCGILKHLTSHCMDLKNNNQHFSFENLLWHYAPHWLSINSISNVRLGNIC